MTKYNAKNERIKRKYFSYLKDATGKSDATIEGVRASLLLYEEQTGFKDFGALHSEQIIAFKKKLCSQRNQRTGKQISIATVHTTVQHLKAFYRWLAFQSGFKSKIYIPDIEYFSLSDKQVATAKAENYKEAPTMEQIRHVITNMRGNSDIARRNQALVAFTILSGMRDSAIISLKMKHVDVVTGLIRQDPREVKTKFSKTINTFFFPVGDDIRAIVLDWIAYLRKDKLFGMDDPIFPKPIMGVSKEGGFEVQGLSHEHWQTASPMRAIFREAFEAAGLRYYHPHLFRHNLVTLGQTICKTPEEFKAWSQNLGHDEVMTTFTSYGSLSTQRQGELIKNL
ncbi:MAG: tyrosine-type recombinase/integrase [Rickettsiales bacterium]